MPDETVEEEEERRVFSCVKGMYEAEYGNMDGFKEWMNDPSSKEERNLAFCNATDIIGLAMEREGKDALAVRI